MTQDTVCKCSCGAIWDWFTDSIVGSCHEPCRFIMAEVGEGDPPIPSADFIAGYRLGAARGLI